MSVLVDVGYNYSKVGTGIINNGSASPQVVSLVAPGFNSYYATIYWDTVNATAGVSYGVPLITPAPYLPDDITLVPLAFVLIGNGTTSITASNITDIRFAVVETAPLKKNFGVITTNQSLNCYAASKVVFYAGVSTAFNPLITLTNYRIGTPITLRFDNSYSVAVTMNLTVTTPSGAGLTVVQKFGSTVTSNTSLVVPAGVTVIGNGDSFMFSTTPTLDIATSRHRDATL